MDKSAEERLESLIRSYQIRIEDLESEVKQIKKDLETKTDIREISKKLHNQFVRSSRAKGINVTL